jgi:hypothetical protein
MAERDPPRLRYEFDPHSPLHLPPLRTVTAWLLGILLAQGALGAFDTLYNHEHVERLRHRPQARPELVLHAIRESIYAALFLGLAWFAWQGAAALAIGALVAAEVAITALDEAVENRSRVLPQNERVLHVFLTLNLGLIVAALVPVLGDWAARPTGIVFESHGLPSIALTALGLASATWSALDGFASRRLSRSCQAASPPQY